MKMYYYNQNPPPYFHSQVQMVTPQPQPMQPQPQPPPMQALQPQPPPFQVLQPSVQMQIQVPSPSPAPIIVTQNPATNYVESEEVCCSTAKTWTNLIAWLQIIGYGLAFISAIILLAELGPTREKMYSYQYKQSLRQLLASQEYNDGVDIYVESMTRKMYAVSVMFAVILLIVSAFGFLAGVLLQQGVSQKKPNYLTSWIVYTVFSILVAIGTAIALSAIENRFNGCSLLFMGNLGFNIFSIWVVSKHRSELEDYKTRQMNQGMTVAPSAPYPSA